MLRSLHLFAPISALILSACATTPPAASIAAAPERDRRAILAMAGEYRVEFSFRETVALTPGYTLKPPKQEPATEWVLVLEDTPQKISLQHILVMGEQHTVVKHWRQDWVWQPRATWIFEGHRRWTRRALATGEAQGTWEQSVWEVDDSPRYFGLGRWMHAHGVSQWSSAPSPRPLPRREYTTRSDYDILLAINRHAITPAGWVHEQDNTKLVAREGRDAALAREVGVNTYTRLAPGDYDFSAGRNYWQRSAPFWATVRAWWAQRLAGAPVLHLHEQVDGRLLYQQLFERALREPRATPDEIAQLLLSYERSEGSR